MLSTKQTNKASAQRIGQDAEEAAYQFLAKHGLKLIIRNYRCKLGEIDLIMRDKEYLVFVEVRFRRYAAFGSSSESVNYFKQAKLMRAAQFYLQQHCLIDKTPCRFDVIAVALDKTQLTLEWIKNAFSMPS